LFYILLNTLVRAAQIALEGDFPGCDAFSKEKVMLRRRLPRAARMLYKELQVQLQGVSVTGYRVKEDGEDIKTYK
jgi:hypothetical protein